MADNVAVTYTFVNNTPADADEVNQNFADLVGYINPRLGALASTQILVGSATGVATPRTVSGDITLSNTGVATIGNDKITTAKILDDAVTQAKIAPGAVGATEVGSFPAVELTKTAAQNIPSDVDTAISFDTEVVDTASLHDGVTPTRITFPVAGFYLVVGLIAYADTLGDGKYVAGMIQKNGGGGAFLGHQRVHTGFGGDNVVLTVTALSKFAASDYVELLASHSAGSSKALATGATDGCRFSAQWIGAG